MRDGKHTHILLPIERLAEELETMGEILEAVTDGVKDDITGSALGELWAMRGRLDGMAIALRLMGGRHD